MSGAFTAGVFMRNVICRSIIRICVFRSQPVVSFHWPSSGVMPRTCGLRERDIYNPAVVRLSDQPLFQGRVGHPDCWWLAVWYPLAL
jgi:hypothetical protein